MRPACWRALWAGLVAALVAPGGWTLGAGAAEVTELRELDQLRAAFNKDRGVARLVLLLSPT